MGIAQSFMLALKSLLNNKMRAFLTMLGIIIGVGSVILIMSLGNGMTMQVSETFESAGTMSVRVMLMGRGSTRSFSVDDMYAFADEHEDIVKAMTPSVSLGVSVRPNGWNENLTSSVSGVGEDYLTVNSYEIGKGRFLTYADIANRKKVCFVGSYLDSPAVYNGKALGNTIKINGDIYTIVGVCDEITDSTDEDGSDNFIVLPYSVATRLARNASIDSFTLLATGEDAVQTLKQEITNRLYEVYEDEDAYNVIALADMLDMVNEVMGTMVVVIACIAGISLLVGGIGIMNIMLVSVTERTREIGIRKALGAKRRDIRLQFVIEAMTTSLLGGVLGILFGTGGAQAVGPLLDLKAVPSVSSIVFAVGISVGIGVLFGYLPANKAAKLNPIDALRYE